MFANYIEAICDEGIINLVRNNESSLHTECVIPRLFLRSLLGRIQGTRHFVRRLAKVVISKVR